MRLDVHLTGLIPLVMENPQMSDPECDFKRAIKAITDKSKKTDDDRHEIERLEFLGSLYLGTDGPFIPSTNLRKCWIDAARATREGKDIERSVIIKTIEIPVEYNGPRDPQALWSAPAFRWRTMVNGNPGSSKGGRVPRMRPWFPSWALHAEVELLEAYMDREKFEKVVVNAGLVEGLGGARRIGYGRYDAVIK